MPSLLAVPRLFHQYVKRLKQGNESIELVFVGFVRGAQACHASPQQSQQRPMQQAAPHQAMNSSTKLLRVLLGDQFLLFAVLNVVE